MVTKINFTGTKMKNKLRKGYMVTKINFAVTLGVSGAGSAVALSFSGGLSLSHWFVCVELGLVWLTAAVAPGFGDPVLSRTQRESHRCHHL